MTAPIAMRERDLRDADLHPLLLTFYDTLSRDELLASYFERLDMREHMPRITTFWSTLLFHTRSYSGSAFRPHLLMRGLTPAHFARWVATLEAAVDAQFAGPAASTMKELAHRIAFSMQMRLGLTPFEPYKELSPEVVTRSAR